MNNDFEKESEREKIIIKGEIESSKLERKKTLFIIAGLVAAGVGITVISQMLGIPENEADLLLCGAESAVSMGVVVSAGALHKINQRLRELKERENEISNGINM